MIIFWSVDTKTDSEKRGYINSSYIEVSSFRLLGYQTSQQSGSLTYNYLQYFQRTKIFYLCTTAIAIMANGGGMKRWGVRASFLSTDTKVDAWQDAQVTT